ncbi:hypothetical protein [Roseitranquillus sediminis]|uniref:hypothetical protein n=1 Tax=Roseitranquillus sediminis TaxID=2809051 RepID=UPI001D0C1343|nr:hypothetical protein [Roseitranquillus sediminis]MBM9594465.1 hypothetical protein [Roseitranquillus sediminis]
MHPLRTARTGAQILALAKEFASGGVVVGGGGLSTTLQADGDVQVCVYGRLEGEDQLDAALEAHFRDVEQRLRPMTQAREVVALLRGTTGSLATATGGITEVVRGFSAGSTSLSSWLPHILTLVLVLLTLMAPRVLWWLMRHRLRQWQRTPQTSVPAAG